MWATRASGGASARRLLTSFAPPAPGGRLTLPGMRNHAPGGRECEAAFTSLEKRAVALPNGVVDDVVSPALVVHLDAARRNIAQVIRLCGGDPNRWRPHVKTAKLRAVYAELARASVRRYKAATPREADVLASVLEAEGVACADILVAHPLVGPGLARLARVAERFAGSGVTFSVLVETVEAARELPPGVGCFVDVNPGMHRTGMPVDAAEAGEAVRCAVAAGGLESDGGAFRGVHFYDGHSPVAWVDPAERRDALWALYDRLLALDESMGAAGVGPPELVTAGTPSLTSSLSHAGLEATGRHRVSPGTAVLHDFQYELLNPDLHLEPAAVIVSRVVSHPAEGRFTLDAGSKSVAAEAGHPVAYIVGHPEFECLGPSEEHLPVDTRGHAPLARGDVVYLVPRHVCPTVNLAERAVLVDRDANGAPFVVGVADVEARAHDVLVSEPLVSERFDQGC